MKGRYEISLQRRRIVRLVLRLLLLISAVLVLPATAKKDTINIQALVDKAVSQDASIPVDIVQAAKGGDQDALYKVAKQIQETDLPTSAKLLHWLADQKPTGHVLSQAALGFLYYSHDDLKDKKRALHYFVQAGENGPHQAALYNAGRIHAEQSEWVPAMAYIQSAAQWEPGKSRSQLTQTCIEAYESLSHQLARQQELTIEESADIFLYGSLQGYPSADDEAMDWWRTAMQSLVTFHKKLAKNKKKMDQKSLESVVANLRRIWERDASHKLSKLQGYLLLIHINQALRHLTEDVKDDAYIPAAAGYAEALARSDYCYLTEDCFDHASSQATAYYQKSLDGEGTQRVAELVQQHGLLVEQAKAAQVQADGSVDM